MSWSMNTTMGPVEVIGATSLRKSDIVERDGRSEVVRGTVDVLLGVASYADNRRVALLGVLHTGEVYAKLSSNLPDEPMEDGEFAVPVHNIGEHDAARLLHCGAPIVDTGRKVRSGFVEMPVYRVTGVR